MQTLHLQHRCPNSHRVKSRVSYVDETLFGSSSSTRPPLPDFDPPWVQNSNRTRGVGRETSKDSLAKRDCESTPSKDSTPTLTSKKKNKYRLISHTPSYCDESLFGFQQEGANRVVTTEDAAKLRALFWTPPATPGGNHSPHPRETPVRAVHPVEPSQTEPRVTASSGKSSLHGLDVACPLGRGRSNSLTHLSVPRKSHPAACAPYTNGPQHTRPSTSGVTFQSPRVTPRAQSGSLSVLSVSRRGGMTPKPKPPWK